jgi:transposase
MIGVAPILPNQTIAGLPVRLIPDESTPSESDVLADQILLLKNPASDILEQGAQLFDRVTGRLWEIESKVEEDELNYRFTVRGVGEAAFTTADVDDGLAVEAGFFVQANGRTDTLVLPAGVPVENLYLGQRVTASVNGVFPANARTPTRIAAIREERNDTVNTTGNVPAKNSEDNGSFQITNIVVSNLKIGMYVEGENISLGTKITSIGAGEGNTDVGTITLSKRIVAGDGEVDASLTIYGTTVTIELDREILDTAFTAVQFDRNVGATGFRNNVGFNEDGIVLASGSSRMVRTNVFDSVYDGIRIEGVATSGSHEIGGTFGDNLVQQNNAIYGNQLTGIRFAESFFAGLGSPDTYETDIVSRVNQVNIQGNFLSTTIFSQAGRTNGISGVSNLVFDEPNLGTIEGYAGIQADYVNSTARTTEIINEVEVERYIATYRPEDNPTHAAFAEIGDRDLKGNFHYSGNAVVIDDSIGGGPVDGGGGGTGDGTGTGGTGSGSWSPGTR